MSQDGRDPVIELDERGIDLLKSWMRPCTEFRAILQPDGSIVLHPMSAHDADLWRSGLVDQIIESFSHPEQMIRLKAENLRQPGCSILPLLPGRHTSVCEPAGSAAGGAGRPAARGAGTAASPCRRQPPDWSPAVTRPRRRSPGRAPRLCRIPRQAWLPGR